MTFDPISQLCIIAMRGHIRGLFASLIVHGWAMNDEDSPACSTVAFPKHTTTLWKLMSDTSELSDDIRRSITAMQARKFDIECTFKLIQPLPIYDKCEAYPLLGIFPADMDDLFVYGDEWNFRFDYIHAPTSSRPRCDCFPWIVCETHHDIRLKMRSLATWWSTSFPRLLRGRP